MTTLVLPLSEQTARRVARAADELHFDSHEALGLEALRLFLDARYGPVRGRRPLSSVEKQRRRARRAT